MSRRGVAVPMAAMPSDAPMEPPPPPAPPGSSDAQRQARYNYLVGRLRGRQITMEEATELFAVMQALLRASDAARRAAGAPAPSRSEGLARPVPEARRPRGAAPAASDDMFLVGLLAMGAGAGLLAAMARRLADGTPPSPPSDRTSGNRRGV
jgi:hypothetical protein